MLKEREKEKRKKNPVTFSLCRAQINSKPAAPHGCRTVRSVYYAINRTVGVLISGGKFNGGSTHRGFTVEYSAVEVKGQKKEPPSTGLTRSVVAFPSALSTQGLGHVRKRKKRKQKTQASPLNCPPVWYRSRCTVQRLCRALQYATEGFATGSGLNRSNLRDLPCNGHGKWNTV